MYDRKLAILKKMSVGPPLKLTPAFEKGAIQCRRQVIKTARPRLRSEQSTFDLNPDHRRYNSNPQIITQEIESRLKHDLQGHDVNVPLLSH